MFLLVLVMTYRLLKSYTSDAYKILPCGGLASTRYVYSLTAIRRRDVLIPVDFMVQFDLETSRRDT